MVEGSGALPVGTVVAGRYRIDKLLGSGGFGSVYAATGPTTSTRVALKILDRTALDVVGGEARFRREAELARRLIHPNVVRVIDEGRAADGTLYIAFELLEGRSVEEELKQWGAMRQRRAADIVCDVLLALEEAHRAGIVHRDLKPANVYLLAGSDRVKVLDFGIAKSVNPGTIAGLTAQGMLIGSPVYMADEQLTGGEIGPQTDLYAVGVLLLEMLLGRAPYDEASGAMEIVSSRLGGKRVPIPPEVKQLPLGDVVERATQPRPSDRYASAAAMRDAIRAITTSPTFVDGAVASVDGPSAAFSRSEVFGPTQGVPSGPAPQPPLTAAAGPGGFAPYTVAGAPVGAVTPPLAGGGTAGPSPGAATEPSGGAPVWPATEVPAGGFWTPPAPTAPPMAGAWAPAPPRSSNAPWIWLAVAAAMVLVMGVGAAAFIGLSSRASVSSVDESEPSSVEEQPPRPIPSRTAAPVATLAPKPEVVAEAPVEEPRTKACPGARRQTTAALKQHTRAIGWRITGKLIYCPGNMVNFRCVGVQSDGFTAEKGGDKGSVALLRFGSAAKAQSYVAGERQGVTLATAGNVVIRIDMPEAEADRLTARICR